MDQFMFLLIVGTTVWVGFDAQELQMRRGRLGGGPIDMGTRSWVVCCLLLWVITFPCYLVARRKYVAMRDAPQWPAETSPSPFAQFSAAGVGLTPIAPVPDPVPSTQVEAHTAPPQLSPDGHWWWDGGQWVPATAVGAIRG
jgi:hypothetical protein